MEGGTSSKRSSTHQSDTKRPTSSTTERASPPPSHPSSLLPNPLYPQANRLHRPRLLPFLLLRMTTSTQPLPTSSFPNATPAQASVEEEEDLIVPEPKWSSTQRPSNPKRRGEQVTICSERVSRPRSRRRQKRPIR